MFVFAFQKAAKGLVYRTLIKAALYPLSQVTILIYLSVVGSLLLYMLFLLLVDPLIRKHDPYIQPLHNEEDSDVIHIGTHK